MKRVLAAYDFECARACFFKGGCYGEQRRGRVLPRQEDAAVNELYLYSLAPLMLRLDRIEGVGNYSKRSRNLLHVDARLCQPTCEIVSLAIADAGIEVGSAKGSELFFGVGLNVPVV